MSLADDRLSVKTICKLTGINEHTLRAWERRYQLVEPERLGNGRRIYSLDDLEKLKLVNKLLAQGFLIGNIAKQNPEQLTQLLHETSVDPIEAQTASRKNFDLRIVAAVEANAYHLAHHQMNLAMTQMGLRSFLFDLIIPLRTKLAASDSEHSLRPGQVRALQVIMESILLETLYKINQPDRIQDFRTRSLALAKPLAGAWQIDSAITGILCASNEFPLVYLGEGCEAESLIDMVEQASLNTVCLGCLSVEEIEAAKPIMEHLIKHLKPSCEIWLISDMQDLVSLFEPGNRSRFRVFSSFEQLDYTLGSYR